MITPLDDLPQFKILDTSKFLRGTNLFGALTRVPELGNGAIRLYVPNESFWGTMDGISRESKTATLWTSDWKPDGPVQIGTSWPVIDACWRLEFIDAILNPEHPWKRVKFIPRDAQHFEESGRRGWAPAAQPLSENATPLHIELGGWDHEHCEICMQTIGHGGDAFGYVDDEDQWLCEGCYTKHADSHDLSFVFPLPG